MKSNLSSRLSEFQRKIIVILGILLDLFRREDGLIKRKIGKHIMYLDPKDEGISKTLRRMKPNSEREPAFMHVLREETKAGMVALDLGANIGHVTLTLAELVGKNGKVYALEPNPRNFNILVKNIMINNYTRYVFPYHVGGSNKSGELNFHLSAHSNLGSMEKTEHTTETIKVPVFTMDDFFRDKEHPNFIKMDIEGHEVEVLEGMYQTLKSAPPPVKLLMEVHPKFYSEEHNFEFQLRRLLEMGFKTKYIISGGLARPDFFVENGYEPFKVYKIPQTEFKRGIYADVSDEHMLIAVCREHKQFNKRLNIYVKYIVRAIMIEK